MGINYIARKSEVFIKYWLPVIIYAIIIFCVSAVPGKDIPAVFAGQDIFAHMFEYALLAFLISRALKQGKAGSIYIRRIGLVFVLSFLYALSDEFHQIFVPGRVASGWDLFVDGIGIILGNLSYR